MPDIDFRDDVVLDATRQRQIRERVRDHERLDQALRFWASATPPARPVLTVAQDEFSHDVVFSLSADLAIAYEVT